MNGFLDPKASHCFRCHFKDKQHHDIEVIMANPFKTLNIQYGELTQDVIDDINDYCSTFKAISNIPFLAGVGGFIGYDFAAKKHGIITATHQSRQPEPDIYLAFYDGSIVINHTKKETIALCYPIHDDSILRFDALISMYKHQTGTLKPFACSDFEPQISFKEYEQGFNDVKRALTMGRCYQVNYTQPFVASYQGNPHDIYQHIALNNKVPYGAYIKNNELSILSFSPERFLSTNQQQILTSPIKGTSRRSQQPFYDYLRGVRLKNCEKNQAENVMIVDLMRHDLGKIAVSGSVHVPRLLALESYPSVHHLVSDVGATLKPELSAFDALLSCFPGGSITGAPKIEAMKVISEVEPWGRGIYCGSIFMLSMDGRLESNIAIRTISAHNNQMILQTGGAIVIDSDCQKEYDECEAKAHAIKSALGKLC